MDGIYYFIIFIILVLILFLIKKTKNYLKQYLSEFLTSIGAIGLTIIDIQSNSKSIFVKKTTWEDAWVYLLVIFAIIIFIAIIIGAKRNNHNINIQDEINKNNKLEKEIKSYKEEYYKLCSTNILHLFESFYTTPHDRISIYKHQGDHFILLGRRSNNPTYNKFTNYKYKDNEGLIGKAWDENEIILLDVPKWVQNVGTEYKSFMKEHCNITDKRLKSIRMKSRSLYIKTINDNNTASNPDGIIVFESMDPKKIKKEECDKLITDNEKALLTLLKNMRSLTNKIN